ncbi:MAG: hypothetical protein JWP38_758 [Herbaspirillum sp.]|nr:hypothetical protein [Herbaspirillum sp.]
MPPNTMNTAPLPDNIMSVFAYEHFCHNSKPFSIA